MKQLRQLLSLHSIVIEVSVAVEMIWIRKKLLVSPCVCLVCLYQFAFVSCLVEGENCLYNFVKLKLCFICTESLWALVTSISI
jgi:hypothetical protein